MKLNAVAALLATTYAEQLPPAIESETMLEDQDMEMRQLKATAKVKLYGDVIPEYYWTDMKKPDEIAFRTVDGKNVETTYFKTLSH